MISDRNAPELAAPCSLQILTVVEKLSNPLSRDENSLNGDVQHHGDRTRNK